MLPLPLACTVAKIGEETDQIQTNPQKVGVTVIRSMNFSITGEWVD